MGKVEAGDLSVRISTLRNDEIGLLFQRFNVMTARLETLMEETLEEQRQLMIAERKALLSQINPHFLYNTLGTIKSAAKLEGVESIVTIVTGLGKLLRSTIESEEEFVSLGESLNLVESYLAIQRIRFGEKLSTEIIVPDELKPYLIPKLIIQPIVENGIIHGLEPKLGNGKILIDVNSDDHDIQIQVTDDGVGFRDPWSSDSGDGKSGIGLQNINKRLIIYYGDKYALQVNNLQEGGTSVVVRIPKKGAGENG